MNLSERSLLSLTLTVNLNLAYGSSESSNPTDIQEKTAKEVDPIMKNTNLVQSLEKRKNLMGINLEKVQDVFKKLWKAFDIAEKLYRRFELGKKIWKGIKMVKAEDITKLAHHLYQLLHHLLTYLHLF